MVRWKSLAKRQSLFSRIQHCHAIIMTEFRVVFCCHLRVHNNLVRDDILKKNYNYSHCRNGRRHFLAISLVVIKRRNVIERRFAKSKRDTKTSDFGCCGHTGFEDAKNSRLLIRVVISATRTALSSKVLTRTTPS